MHTRLLPSIAASTAASTVLLLLFACLATAPALAGDSSYSQIARGHYLVRAGDCAACHTAEGGKPFAGGRAVPTPFGKIYAPNITPDKDTGIGNWSGDDFYKAMHEGIDPEGEHLYPAFPYPWFTRMSRDDVRAIKAYLDTLPPVRNETRPPQLPWPMSWRGSLAIWNKLYFHPGAFQPRTDKSVEWNRGAYLVEGPGHCGACHTPKNVLGATKHDQELTGGSAGEHWFAADLGGDLHDGLGRWSAKDIIDYLKTGSNGKTAAAGPMADVVEHSTQHLSDSDLSAIATYLKDMPKEHEEKGEDKGEENRQQVTERVMTDGGGLYLDNCAGCHMENGGGQPDVFPSLKGSAAVQAKQPDTLIHVVLAGAEKPSTKTKPTGLQMPSFRTKLNDSQVADLVTFIRNAWGNHAPTTDADAVKKVHESLGGASAG